MIKNATGQHISFIAIATADGAAVTTGTPTVYLSKDGAAQATSSNTASHLGNGVWVLDLTQAETNAAHLSAVMVLTNAVNSFAQAFPVVQADFKADVSALALSRHYTFNNSSASDYVDVTLNNDVATNFPKVQKAIVRLKISGSVASSSDWRLKLHPPSGGPSGGFDLISGVTLSTFLSNKIIQTEVDLTDADVVDGSWSIVLEDINTSGNVLSINDAEIEFSDVPASIGDATAASQTSISNAISALNDFDPAADTVGNVTTVGSVTSAVTTSNASDVTAIKAVTDNLPDSGALTSIATASALSTVDTVVDGIKAVTDNLPDSGALTSLATAASISGLNDFDPATQTVTTDAASRTASQADVSSLATAASISALNDFDPTTQTVTTDAASRTASQADVSSLATASDLAVVDSNVDAIKVKTDQMVFSNANELDCNAVTGGGGDDAATIYSYFTASSRQDTFRADVSSLATAASISGLNDFDPATQTVTTDTASRTASQADVSSLATAASISALNDISSLDIYNYFTASNRQDTFKATGFATVNPDNTSITAIKAKTDSLTFTIANQVDANALTGGADPVGSGAISHTVTVNIDNVPANAVDVWVTTDAAGTNVVAGTLVTNQAGQATFQLDAGSYYLWCQRSGVNFTNPTAFTVS